MAEGEWQFNSFLQQPGEIDGRRLLICVSFRFSKQLHEHKLNDTGKRLLAEIVCAPTRRSTDAIFVFFFNLMVSIKTTKILFKKNVG